MVQTSFCILSSTSPSLFPSNSAADSPSTSYLPSPRTLFLCRRSPRFSKFKVLSKQLSIDGNSNSSNGSAPAEQFLQNNSIADFMRFRQGSNSDDRRAELQTALVSYRKRFPWSILQPFLRVNLQIEDSVVN